MKEFLKIKIKYPGLRLQRYSSQKLHVELKLQLVSRQTKSLCSYMCNSLYAWAALSVSFSPWLFFPSCVVVSCTCQVQKNKQPVSAKLNVKIKVFRTWKHTCAWQRRKGQGEMCTKTERRREERLKNYSSLSIIPPARTTCCAIITV